MLHKRFGVVPTGVGVLAIALGGALGISSPAPAIVLGLAAAVGLAWYVPMNWSADRLGYIMLSLAVLTSTWNGVRLGGGGAATRSGVATGAEPGGVLPVDVFLAASVVIFAGVVLNRSTIYVPRWLALPAVALPASAMLALVFPVLGAGVEPGIASLLKFLVALIAVPVVVALAAKTPLRRSRVLDMWAFSALVSAAVAILAQLGVADITSVVTGVEGPPGPRQQGLASQENHLAIASAIAVPAVLLWFLRGGVWRVCGLAGVAVLTGGILASGSRAGAGALVVGVVLTMAFVPRLRKVGLKAAMTGLVVAALLLPTTTELFASAANQVRLGPTAEGTFTANAVRAERRDQSLDYFMLRPIQGVGYGLITAGHNIYLQLLASGGIIAFTAFGVYMAGVGSLTSRCIKGSEGAIALVTAVCTLVWLAAGLVSNQLTDRYLYVPIGVLLAIASWSSRASQPEESYPPRDDARPYTTCRPTPTADFTAASVKRR